MGVALGVAILIVVMSVMNGFEIEVKKRLLAFSPHVTLRYAPDGAFTPILDWQQQGDALKNYPEISEVVGSIDDNAIIEHNGNQLPIAYRGIDTTDKKQLADLEELIIKDYQPFGTADMGLDAKGVILESKATEFGIQVGDTVQLYSTRNFDEVFDAYKRTERPKAAEEFKDELQGIITQLKEKRVRDKTPETFLFSSLATPFEQLIAIIESGIRPGEVDAINEALEVLDSGTKSGVNDEYRILPKGSIELLDQLLITHLAKIDNTLDDNEELKKLKSIVLPIDIEIVGVYRISQQVVAPSIFLPLPIAQELSGLDEGVHALSLRLHDVDKATELSQRITSDLDYKWYASSWMDRYRDFFEVVKMQESMMAMVLSTVAVGASFLITIVMFLTALQKRKEIGVMLAVGAKPMQICGIFLIQGIIIGFFGVALGIVLGLTILHFRGEIQGFFLNQGMDIFNASFQGMETLPAETPPSLIINISIMALVMCSLAPLLPALFAAMAAPAKSLRNL